MNKWLLFSLILIPIAVIAIFSFFLYKEFFVVDTMGLWKDKTRKQLPELAVRLGLKYTVPVSNNDVGELTGTYHSHQVRVWPENSIVTFSIPERAFYATSFKPDVSTEKKGWELFEFKNGVANKFLLTRYASAGLSQKAQAFEKVGDAVEQFYNAWHGTLQYIQIDGDEITVRFEYGDRTYVPADKLQAVLDDLVSLASALESLDG